MYAGPKHRGHADQGGNRKPRESRAVQGGVPESAAAAAAASGVAPARAGAAVGTECRRVKLQVGCCRLSTNCLSQSWTKVTP